MQGLSSQPCKTTNAIVIGESRAPHYALCTPPERGEVSIWRDAMFSFGKGRIACFEVSTPVIVLISYSNRHKRDRLNRLVAEEYSLITAAYLASQSTLS
jgi:hypothetical protein